MAQRPSLILPISSQGVIPNSVKPYTKKISTEGVAQLRIVLTPNSILDIV
jgi:hypothetical protein